MESYKIEISEKAITAFLFPFFPMHDYKSILTSVLKRTVPYSVPCIRSPLQNKDPNCFQYSNIKKPN